MPDREKAMTDREEITAWVESRVEKLQGIDYRTEILGLPRDMLMRRFLEIAYLLKEQEAVEPKKVKGYNPPMYTFYEYECEKCKSPIINKQPFCMGCGRAVKWE